MKPHSYARRLVDEALREGYYLSVHDGEEWPVVVSRDRDAIVRAMESVDICHLRIRGAMVGDKAGPILGNALIVYGNDPDEEIADYTDNQFMHELVEHL